MYSAPPMLLMASAGAYGDAANESVASALNATNGKLLKVASAF